MHWLRYTSPGLSRPRVTRCPGLAGTVPKRDNVTRPYQVLSGTMKRPQMNFFYSEIRRSFCNFVFQKSESRNISATSTNMQHIFNSIEIIKAELLIKMNIDISAAYNVFSIYIISKPKADLSYQTISLYTLKCCAQLIHVKYEFDT